MELAEPESQHIWTMKTVQIAPFRTLMTALKDILTETNITIQPDGIRLVNMDKSHTNLVHMFLASQNFEVYECQREKIVIGVNIVNLFKVINLIENNETLTMFIDREDYNDGVVHNLSFKYENAEIKQRRTFKLKLCEPDQDELEIPDVTFSSIINLPSQDFQKIIRDLSILSNKVEIKSVGDELIFRCSGGFASGDVVRAESDGSMTFGLKPDSSKIVQGEFSLKNLGYFIKCTNLCSHIELYLENDLPLIVMYKVASLGEIKLCLVPLPSV